MTTPVRSLQRRGAHRIGDARQISVVIAALLTCAVIACQQVLKEPGTPPATRSPLFRGLESYQTLEQAAKVLPKRETWKVLFDSKSASRDGCPRFDEFTFEVMATDLGYAGTLRLQFFND